MVTTVVIQRKIEEVGSEGSRKDVLSRKCMKRKEGLECGEREFLSCHLQQVRETSVAAGLLAAPAAWAAPAARLLPPRGRGAAAVRCLWHLPSEVADLIWTLWCLESKSLSSHGAAGAFRWLLNLFCFRYLSKPGKFLNTTNVPQVGEASLAFSLLSDCMFADGGGGGAGT